MIDKFIRDLKARSRSKATIRSIMDSLNEATKIIKKPLESVEPEDILDYIEELKKSKSSGTVNLRISKLIQFYGYCFEETDEIRYNKIIKKLKKYKSTKPEQKIKPSDISTPDDVKQIINKSSIERNRCLIASLFEGGLRNGEFRALTCEMVKLNHEAQEVTFEIPNEEGCKTGGRPVPCVEIYPYVMDWLKCHPDPKPTSKFMQLSDRHINEILKNMYAAAGIDKICNSHMLRHSAITYAVIIKMTESDIKLRFWGNLKTNMLDTYIHLSHQIQAQGYRQAKGLIGESQTVINPLASKCLKCGRLIPHQIKHDGSPNPYCVPCGDNEKLNSKLKSLVSTNTSLQSQIDHIKTDFLIRAGIRREGMEKKSKN